MLGVRTTARWLATTSVAALLTTGCGSARVARRDARGGTIVLDGDRAKAVDEAHQLMVDHCRGPYQIVDEGQPSPGEDGEWRITYVCGRQDGPDRPDHADRAPVTAEPAAGNAAPPDAAPPDAAPRLPTVLDLIGPPSADAGP